MFLQRDGTKDLYGLEKLVGFPALPLHKRQAGHLLVFDELPDVRDLFLVACCLPRLLPFQDDVPNIGPDLGFQRVESGDEGVIRLDG